MGRFLKLLFLHWDVVEQPAFILRIMGVNEKFRVGQIPFRLKSLFKFFYASDLLFQPPRSDLLNAIHPLKRPHSKRGFVSFILEGMSVFGFDFA